MDQARITVSSHGARAMTLCKWISTWIRRETAILPESGNKFNDRTAILAESGNKCKDPTAILAESGTHAEDPTAILAESGTHSEDPTAILAESGKSHRVKVERRSLGNEWP